MTNTSTAKGSLSVIDGSVLHLSDAEMREHDSGFSAVASCLGHNMTFRGVYGHPRRLVTDTTQRLCRAIMATPAQDTVRFMLMDTVGNSNRDLSERTSIPQQAVIGLLRLLLPPHTDNEKAADYLRTEVGNDSAIEWAAVRPANLIDENDISEYGVYESPIRSAIFDPGSTSRVNAADFMADLCRLN